MSQIETVEGTLVLSSIVDIRERKRANEALRESEQRLRLATEAAKIGAFDWNIQTGVNVWTPKMEALYGLAPGEFGRTQPAWEQLLHPCDRAGAVAKAEETLATLGGLCGNLRARTGGATVHFFGGTPFSKPSAVPGPAE